MEDIKTVPKEITTKEINKIKTEPKIPEKITKREVIEYGNFKLLLVFNLDLEVIKLVNFSNRLLKDNSYAENLFYVELEEELFFEIQTLLKTNKLKLSKNPIKEKIGIGDIIKTPLPPKPPTEDQVLGQMAIQSKLNSMEMKKRNECLGELVVQLKLQNMQLSNQMQILGKTMIENKIKLMEIGGKNNE